MKKRQKILNFSELIKLSKKIIKKEEKRKLLKIKEKNEKIGALIYLVSSKFKEKLHDLEIFVSKNRAKLKNLSDILWYLDLTKHRIKFFELDATKENFYKVVHTFERLERLLKNGS